MTFEQQADKVSIWAWKKGLHKVSTPLIQHDKMVEEVGELRDEIVKGDVKAIEDELGDVLFTACVQAELWGLDPTVCLAKAVAKVTGRKGKMVDGLYVKDPQ
jgi:NTP pyrophosphatase (non-canonical NTP hydrolase)